MNPKPFLIMVIIGIILFYAGQESLARLTFDWTIQPLIVSVWLGGLMLLLFGLFGAYYIAMDRLMLNFPDHLVRMYRGVNKSLTELTKHEGARSKK